MFTLPYIFNLEWTTSYKEKNSWSPVLYLEVPLYMHRSIHEQYVYQPILVRVSTNTCTCINQYLYMYQPVHVHVSTSTCTCINQYMYMYMYQPVHVHVSTSTCTCIDQYMYMYQPVHVHVSTNTCTFHKQLTTEDQITQASWCN